VSAILDRRDLDLKSSRVAEIIPEHYLSEYPKLVSFLEKYYDYLDDANEQHNFESQLKELFLARDVQQSQIKYLDLLISEIGNGIQQSDFFKNPRLMTTLLANYYRIKGSLNSIEGFFRGFYGQEVSVEYPKKNIFIVGESRIGAESLRYIQNNELYQIFSILIKVGLSTADYEDLYKNFVHPAGFYFAGQVLAEEEVDLGLELDEVDDPREQAGPPKFVTEILLEPTIERHDLTALYEQNGTTYRTNLDETINRYLNFTTQQILDLYGPSITIDRLISPNSLTFDNDSAVMSLAIETMDNDMFTRYTSDSAY